MDARTLSLFFVSISDLKLIMRFCVGLCLCVCYEISMVCSRMLYQFDLCPWVYDGLPTTLLQSQSSEDRFYTFPGWLAFLFALFFTCFVSSFLVLSNC